MELTTSQVLELASQQRLTLSENEVEQLRQDLNSILEFAAVLHDVAPDTDGAPQKPKSVNTLRSDVIRPSLSQQEALQLAPANEEGFFRVPRTVESDGA